MFQHVKEQHQVGRPQVREVAVQIEDMRLRRVLLELAPQGGVALQPEGVGVWVERPQPAQRRTGSAAHIDDTSRPRREQTLDISSNMTVVGTLHAHLIPYAAGAVGRPRDDFGCARAFSATAIPSIMKTSGWLSGSLNTDLMTTKLIRAIATGARKARSPSLSASNNARLPASYITTTNIA